MTSSNRLRISVAREVTPGVTPVSPRMRKMRITGESLAYQPSYIDSEEIRDDRMMTDPALVMRESNGGVNFELSYPADQTPLSDFIASAMFNGWVSSPARFNDGVADSIITGAVASTDTYSVTTGAAFVAGQLVLASGFALAANNGLFKAQTGSNATAVVAPASPGLVDEPVPPGEAALKVVGFEGTAADITATSTGLGSTALNFTTLGLSVGMFIKIGGTAVGNRFATAANNGYARITAIAATALTLDNLPTGWAADTGTGKTIRVFIPDTIMNGVTPLSMVIERGFMGQTAPTYIVTNGLQVNTMQIQMASKQMIKGNVAFLGMGGSVSDTSIGSSPDAETTYPVMASNSSVSLLTEGGAATVGENWSREFEITVNNNLRALEALDSISPVAIVAGECSVTGKISRYFGDKATLDKFYAGTATSFAAVAAKGSRAFLVHVPRATLRGGGNPSASGKNQDIMASFDFTASKDTLTGCHAMFQRFEYVE